MIFLKKLLICLITTFLIPEIPSHEIDKNETHCPKQCACIEEHLSDLMLMKWLTIPMDRNINQTIQRLISNQVYDADEEEVSLDKNPLINTVFCVLQDVSKHITPDQFSALPQALTILHGVNTLNKTIEYELWNFRELVALDIRGYEATDSERDYAELPLQHDTLLLRNIKYINIQHIRLFPKSEKAFVTNVNLSPKPSTNAKSIRNITYLTSDEPEIMPYKEYVRQNRVVFSHLSHLLFLRLFECDLRTINWEMFDGLHSLRTLSLESNNLRTVPDYVFYNLASLKSLILSNNKLRHLRFETLAGLFQLENLDLSGNDIVRLSELTFAPLPNLLNLDVRSNPLDAISASTFEVTNMTKSLLIGSTTLLNIEPGILNNLVNLEKLKLLNLNVSVLEKSLLAGAPNLLYLQLQGKQLEQIDYDAFTNSLLLESLILRKCALVYISMDAFYGLFNLRHLDLSHNALETLPPTIFDNLKSLRELVLTRNKFVTLSWNVLSKLQHVSMIRLENNPWHCSCEMFDWRLLNINKIKETRVAEVSCDYKYDKSPCVPAQQEAYVYNADVTPRCFTPAQFYGSSILHVTDRNLPCRNERLKRKNALFAKPPNQKVPKHKTGDALSSVEINGADFIQTTKNTEEMDEQKSKRKKITHGRNETNVDNSLNNLSDYIYDANKEDDEKKNNIV